VTKIVFLDAASQRTLFSRALRRPLAVALPVLACQVSHSPLDIRLLISACATSKSSVPRATSSVVAGEYAGAACQRQWLYTGTVPQ
jgi:hypothetical protein